MNRLHLSSIGDHFNKESGTRLLMDDLGEVQRGGQHFLNLGGGNPSHVPAVHEWFSRRLAELSAARSLDTVFATYDEPQGPADFREVFAKFLCARLGWPVSAENILCTSGSQASFFMLFNVLAGRDKQGDARRILFPQSPEYIGYSDLCLFEEGLTATASKAIPTATNRFRYEIDFDALNIDETIAALCVSRPTNPSGGVCSDEEMRELTALAMRHEIPLIVDCAYGEPFPGITFGPSQLPWSENLIVCFSLSKLGLPGLRVGIVVAQPDVIGLLTNMNTAMMLTTNSLGSRLASELFESHKLVDLVDTEIRPFYRDRANNAVALCDRYFVGLDYLLHEPGGAIFLWIWFRNLPIRSAELYKRLKQRGVLIIPGHLFAPGLSEPTHQMSECIRVSYAQPPEIVEKGIAIIAEEVRAAFECKPSGSS